MAVKYRHGHLMRLVNARLCLDCEEVHEQQHCPICGSESFAFMTRWVTPSDTVAESPGRPARPQATQPAPQTPQTPTGERSEPVVERRHQLARREQVDAYRQMLNPDAAAPRRGRMVARGALGLALLGLARAVWRSAPEGNGEPRKNGKPGGPQS
jgi:hypothetical protein